MRRHETCSLRGDRFLLQQDHLRRGYDISIRSEKDPVASEYEEAFGRGQEIQVTDLRMLRIVQADHSVQHSFYRIP
jgi:hypothetical protein